MSRLLPLFPLQLVCFPGEKLNLHIFEPRYRQLVDDCVSSDTSFGIVTVMDNSLLEIGTEVQILDIENVHDDGSMDIRTVGVSIFHLEDYISRYPDKLYAGGYVEQFISYSEESDFVHNAIMLRVKELYLLLKVEFEVVLNPLLPLSFQIAHKIGFSLDQEFQLLCIAHEAERQSIILAHLNKVIPILDEMEKAKERIKLNGHFKHLDSLNF